MLVEVSGAGDGKPPLPPLGTEFTGDFSAIGRRFVACFVVFRHPVVVQPAGLGRSGY